MPKNYIGGSHLIDEDNWTLSMVRKFNKEHAYLILEGIENSKRIVKDIHLVVKEGTNNRKAMIIMRDLASKNTLDELKKIGDGCLAYTWDISRSQSDLFVKLVQSEVERSEKNEIDYVLYGNPSLGGMFKSSLSEENKSELIELSREQKNPFIAHSGYSLDMLTASGHNCVSWAKAMIQTMQLPLMESSWKEFIAIIPSDVIPDPDDSKITTSFPDCSIF